MYFINTPWIIKKVFPYGIWDLAVEDKAVYLTFDDGPHPEITSFVLDQLHSYQAKATFFCIGKNVVNHPGTYRAILDRGHRVGNHTHNHLNGWKTSNKDYLNNIREAANHIDSDLFRPPYGRITKTQSRSIAQQFQGMKILMWNILSADFDTKLNAEQCVRNVLRYVKQGSVIVFHDSEKAYPRLQYCLPEVLKQLSERGFSFNVVP